MFFIKRPDVHGSIQFVSFEEPSSIRDLENGSTRLRILPFLLCPVHETRRVLSPSLKQKSMDLSIRLVQTIELDLSLFLLGKDA